MQSILIIVNFQSCIVCQLTKKQLWSDENILNWLFFFRFGSKNSATLLSVAEFFTFGTLFLKNVTSDLCEVSFHALGVFLVNDMKQFLHLFTDVFYLIMGIGVEEYFLQQVVIF